MTFASVVRWAIIIGALVVAVVFYDGLRDRLASKREKKIDAKADTARAVTSRVALTDTTYRTVTIPRYVAAREAIALNPDTAVRAFRRACDLLVSTCELRSAQRDTLIRVQQDQIELLERRPIERHGRTSHYLGAGIEALSRRAMVEVGSDFQLFGPVSLHARGELLLGKATAIRDSLGRDLRGLLDVPKDAARLTATLRWSFR